jgi:peroxiredoxin
VKFINLKTVLIAAGLTFLASVAQAVAVKSGDLAPDFELLGHDGKTHKLSDYKGKHVVLEWFNEGCPYVKKHYDAPDMNMQALQKRFGEKNVVWLTIISSAFGEQGYVDAKGAPDMFKSHKANATALLLDPDGKVGKMFDAKVTPHMYVINGEGKLVYQGAIDDQPSAKAATLKTAKPLFANALDASIAGQKIAEDTTKAYGCGIKYK